MELSPYLNFNGQCAAAFRFYEQCLGGKIVMMQTHGESPMKDRVPADWHDKVRSLHRPTAICRLPRISTWSSTILYLTRPCRTTA